MKVRLFKCATIERKRRWGASVGIVAMLVSTLAVSCSKLKGKDDASSSGSSDDKKAEEKPGPQCVDLPGATRLVLKSSPDGTTLSWLEVTRGDTENTLDLYAMDVKEKKPRKVAADIEDFGWAGKGRFWVVRDRKSGEQAGRFETDQELVLVDSAGKETVLLTEELRYASFAVDLANDTLWVQKISGAPRKIPLATGKAEEFKLSSDVGYIIEFEPDGKSAYANVMFGRGACKVDLSAPEKECKPISAIGRGYTLVDGGALYAPKDSKTVSASALKDTTDQAAKWSTDGDQLLGSKWGKFGLVKRVKDKKTTLLKATVESAEPLFTTATDVEIYDAAVVADDRVVVLVRQPTDDHETDVCFLRGTGDFEFDRREVPKSLVASLPELKKLATGDLADAKIGSVSGQFPMISFTAKGAGPTDPSALRKRAEEIQKRVTEITKQPNLGVSLAWEGNGKEAVSEWRDGGDKFYVGGGDKDKLLFDRAQFTVEVDPGTLFKYRNESSGSDKKFGTYSCNGTVKNIGPTPLDLEVECSITTEYLGTQRERVKVNPSPLPANATAKYDFIAGHAPEDTRVVFKVYAGGKIIPTFNAYAERQALGKK
ncbi:MAG: hypothetical protein U0271_08400 [Polyangiaceae bacterium]